MNGHIGDYSNAAGHVGDHNFNSASGYVGEYRRDTGECSNWEELGYNDFSDCMMSDEFGTGEEIKEKNTKDGSGFMKWFDWGIDSADSILDIKDRLEGGTQVDDGALLYNVNPGAPTQAKSDNTMWYIAGGALVLLVVVGVIVKQKQ